MALPAFPAPLAFFGPLPLPTSLAAASASAGRNVRKKILKALFVAKTWKKFYKFGAPVPLYCTYQCYAPGGGGAPPVEIHTGPILGYIS